jgi:hypothetical protein
MMHSNFKGLACLLTAVLLAGLSVHAGEKKPSKTKLPCGLPAVFSSVDDIQTRFEERLSNRQGIPLYLKEIQTKDRSYCFIMAHRLLGRSNCVTFDPLWCADTTDFYCFVKTKDGWVPFLKAHAKGLPWDLDFQAEGNFIDVMSKSAVVLKLNPPA